MTTLQEAAMRKALEALIAAAPFVHNAEFTKVMMARDAINAALAQQGEHAANIPHTLAGFIGAFESETGHPPTKQEIWNGAIRSFRDLNASAPAPVAQEPVAMLFGTLPVYDKSAPQPAQPVEPNIQNYLEKDNRLSDDEILSIAHRKATRFTHAVAPGQVTYGFSVTHLLDFARAVLEDNPKQPVAAQPKTCETCAHFEHGKLPGVRVHDETCYGCEQYYGSQWEAKNE